MRLRKSMFLLTLCLLIATITLSSCSLGFMSAYYDALREKASETLSEFASTGENDEDPTESRVESEGETETDPETKTETETATETETETEAEGGTQSGTQGGTQSGTQGGTQNGTQIGTQNGTQIGTGEDREGESGGSSEPTVGGGAEAAVVRGLRSSVSVYCSFTTTYMGGSYWNPQPVTQSYYSLGSGVIWKAESTGDAFIVTNFHVVYDENSNIENHVSDKISVYLYGLEDEEHAISATYIGGSANYDIAVLHVKGSDVLKTAIASGAATAVQVGDSDQIVAGERTFAIGNPSTNEVRGISATSGIVSVPSEYITLNVAESFGEVSLRVIRTDAPVNSGNSGGGMFNDRGELIGIVNAKVIVDAVESIGYAIPSSVVRAVANNIIDYCFESDCESVMRGLLGVTVNVTARSTSYDEASGRFSIVEEVSVYETQDGSLSASILEAGDVIESVTIKEKTIRITRQYQLIDAMLDVREGDSVSFTILRDGEEMTVSTVMTKEHISAY